MSASVIDEGGCLAAQRSYWMQIRDAAAIALGRVPPDDVHGDRIRDEHRGRPYRYATVHGRVHDCRTLAQLAEVTRAERTWCSATWPEDR